MALGGAMGGEPTPARRRFAVAVWWHGRAGTPGIALGIALGMALGIVAFAASPAAAQAQNACSSGCRAAYGACYKSTHDRSRCQAQLQRCLEGCIRSRHSTWLGSGLPHRNQASVPLGPTAASSGHAHGHFGKVFR